MNQAACETGVPVDFYAGALASCAIILFAKFVTHKNRNAPQDRWWRWAHYACVISAFSGLTIALLVLGQLVETGEDIELALRQFLFALVVIASTIFAADVWTGGRPSVRQGSTPPH